jgi:hypothetical protein
MRVVSRLSARLTTNLILPPRETDRSGHQKSHCIYVLMQLVRRAHSERFCRDYLHPYFYIVEPDPFIVQRELGVSWLTKGYQHFSAIDICDKKYLRKEASSMRN